MTIVLDADVLIHFSKGEKLSILPQIFPECGHIVLDKVYNELKSIRHQLDNQIHYLKNITLQKFNPSGAMLVEYAKLKNTYGDGESACMAYCRYTSNIIGSSNLRDIKDYCKKNRITYLTTLDFLYYGWKRRLLTTTECTAFIKNVTSKGSKLPILNDISQYVPNTEMD